MSKMNTVDDVIVWLQSLHATDKRGAVTPEKWPEAQTAANVIRRGIDLHAEKIAAQRLELVLKQVFGASPFIHTWEQVALATSYGRGAEAFAFDLLDEPGEQARLRTELIKRMAVGDLVEVLGRWPFPDAGAGSNREGE